MCSLPLVSRGVTWAETEGQLHVQLVKEEALLAPCTTFLLLWRFPASSKAATGAGASPSRETPELSALCHEWCKAVMSGLSLKEEVLLALSVPALMEAPSLQRTRNGAHEAAPDSAPPSGGESTMSCDIMTPLPLAPGQYIMPLPVSHNTPLYKSQPLILKKKPTLFNRSTTHSRHAVFKFHLSQREFPALQGEYRWALMTKDILFLKGIVKWWSFRTLYFNELERVKSHYLGSSYFSPHSSTPPNCYNVRFRIYFSHPVMIKEVNLIYCICLCISYTKPSPPSIRKPLNFVATTLGSWYCQMESNTVSE